MSSVSHILRQTREAKGITLEEVAQRTYIKLPYLSALEEGDIEKLPAPVYIHGYIRQYAKLLGLNGSELVLQYQQDASRPGLSPASKLVLSPAARVSGAVPEPAPEPAPEPMTRPIERSTFPPDLRETSLNRFVSSIEPERQAPEPQANPFESLPVVETSLRERAVPMAETSLREPAMSPAVSAAETSLREPYVPTPLEVQQAKQQAQHIIHSAQREAQEMRVAAERYADQVLAQLESEVGRALQTVRNGRAFLQSRRRKLQES